MSDMNISSIAIPGGNTATSGAATSSGDGCQYEVRTVDTVRRELLTQNSRLGFRPKRSCPWGYLITPTNIHCTEPLRNSSSHRGIAGSLGVLNIRETRWMAAESCIGFH